MKIKLSKSQWEQIGSKTGWNKIAGAVTHSFDMFSEIEKSGIFKTETVNFAADRLIGKVTYMGQKYEISIKPEQDDPNVQPTLD